MYMMRISTKVIISLIIIVFYGVLLYLFHPAINVHDAGCWFFVGLAIVAVPSIIMIFSIDINDDMFDIFSELAIIVPCVSLVVAMIGAIGSCPMFHAGTYSNMVNIENSTFNEHEDELTVDSISLMDTDSARILGNRELGDLTDVVSQFNDDEENYHQISCDGKPIKIAGVDYAGFFRWMANKDKGAPGYVKVDPIKQSADYVSLNESDLPNMIYTPHACFNENAQRRIWMAYPTKIFDNPRMELDDNGKPFYIEHSYSFKTLFGCKDIEGIAVLDPSNGDVEYYDTGNVPEWIDDVYDGDLICEQVTNHYMLQNGFWNTVFSKQGCMQTTDDYGYVNIDGHIWIYTGVTSVNSDGSNTGFILASERTKQVFYMPMSAASEYSAMDSAKGQVQQYGYSASFPSLVSIDGQPTYVMVLKDDSGIVKMYSFVNAESYNIVACDSTLSSARTEYEKAMRDNGVSFSRDDQKMPSVSEGTGTDSNESGTDSKTDDTEKDFKVSVKKTMLADEDGNTYLWILGSNRKVYRMKVADDAGNAMLIDAGSKIKGKAVSDDDGSMSIVSIDSVEN